VTRILYVEDNYDNVYMLKTGFREQGSPSRKHTKTDTSVSARAALE
jgi:CheY-like chemotaxis protein